MQPDRSFQNFDSPTPKSRLFYAFFIARFHLSDVFLLVELGNAWSGYFGWYDGQTDRQTDG